MRNLLAVMVLLFAALSLSAQDIDMSKVHDLSVAISHAEGFGVRHAIPTRYHNPGDLKSTPTLPKMPGQKALGKGEHVIFKSDVAGWNALDAYVVKVATGGSRRYRQDPTILDVAKVYAARWRPWIKIVTTELNVPANTKLADLVTLRPPAVSFPVDTQDLSEIFSAQTQVFPVLAEN